MNSPLPFVLHGAKARGMARRHSPRHPLFRQRCFADDIIITCVRWYLRFKLSYRDLAELARELGVSVAPSTVLRWVIRYVPEFEKCWQAYERPVGDSWRVPTSVERETLPPPRLSSVKLSSATASPRVITLD